MGLSLGWRDTSFMLIVLMESFLSVGLCLRLCYGISGSSQDACEFSLAVEMLS